MHSRRFCSWLVGIWLATNLFMAWVATHNLGGVDSMLKNTGARAQREFTDIGPDRARMMMRFQASELNRYYFETYELFEVGLGIVLVVSILFATNGNRLMMALAVGMLAIVVIEYLTVTPHIIELGRGLDWATESQMIVERQTFWNYHNFYSALELVKLALGFGLAGRLIISGNAGGRRRRRPSSSKEVDAVNHADHSHVDG